MRTAKVNEYYDRIHKLLHSPDSPVMWGNGVCEHRGGAGRGNTSGCATLLVVCMIFVLLIIAF